MKENDYDFWKRVGPEPVSQRPIFPAPGTYTGYTPPCCCGSDPCGAYSTADFFSSLRKPSPGPWDEIYANIKKEILESDNPSTKYIQHLIWFNMFEDFSENGLLYLKSMKGDIPHETQHSEPEEKDREEVRGDGEKGHDDGNSNHKERSDEGNF